MQKSWWTCCPIAYWCLQLLFCFTFVGAIDGYVVSRSHSLPSTYVPSNVHVFHENNTHVSLSTMAWCDLSVWKDGIPNGRTRLLHVFYWDLLTYFVWFSMHKEVVSSRKYLDDTDKMSNMCIILMGLPSIKALLNHQV
jgi:hypothetical protein